MHPDIYFNEHKKLFDLLNTKDIIDAIALINRVYVSGKKIITCGNGGSAHTASHYITDWNKMISIRKKRKFIGFSLCDNVGLISAFANDLSFDEIYSGQLKAIMSKGDLVIAISGSGNSPNVVKAIEFANANGAETLCIVGYDGGELIKISKHKFHVPSFDMQLCEDIHLMFGHIVMKSLCS